MAMRVGLVSDTHGLVRPQVLAFLRGCDHIIHAGDIGSASVLEQFAALAPLTAVRGNNDLGAWASALPEAAFARFGGILVYVLHDRARLAIAPAAAGVRVVVSGHSHRPSIEERDGLAYVNPGSAGPRRFKLPIALAELTIEGSQLATRLVELDVGSAG